MEFAWRESMEALLKDKNVDAVVAILILTKELEEVDLGFIVEQKKRFPEKPIYISFSGDENSNAAAKAFLEPRGVPTFPRIEDTFKVLNIMTQCRESLS